MRDNNHHVMSSCHLLTAGPAGDQGQPRDLRGGERHRSRPGREIMLDRDSGQMCHLEMLFLVLLVFRSCSETFLRALAEVIAASDSLSLDLTGGCRDDGC